MSHKVFILIEPPYGLNSLYVEDIAVELKYTYFSLSDALTSEIGSATDLPDDLAEMERLYVRVLKKYLKNPPKNGPKGFVLDSDCIADTEEAEMLLNILAELGHQVVAVLDAPVSIDECLANAEELADDDAEEIITLYFEKEYPELKNLFISKGLNIIEIKDEWDQKRLKRELTQILKNPE